MDSFFNGGDNILSMILIVAVAVSLCLSVTSLVLQLRKKRPGGKEPAEKVNESKQGNPPAPPPINSGYSGAFPLHAPAPWKAPPPAMQDARGHTEALFAPQSQYWAAAAGDKNEQMRTGEYLVNIRETSPEGEKNHEIAVCGELTVGRAASNGIQIDNTTVSGLQCVLIAGPDGVFVSNRSGANITKLNGVKLAQTLPLKAGDTLGLGSVQLSLVSIRKYVSR